MGNSHRTWRLEPINTLKFTDAFLAGPSITPGRRTMPPATRRPHGGLTEWDGPAPEIVNLSVHA
jgi:hypothetical protein